MKKLFSLKTILVCIAFTVFLLYVKDNIKDLWGAFSTLFGVVLAPFIIGFLFAYILNFPYKFFYATAFKKMGTKRKMFLKFKKPLAIVCTYTILVAVLVFLVSILVPQITGNIASLVKHMPDYYSTCTQYINSFIEWLNNTFHFGIDEDNFFSNIMHQLSKYFSVENISTITGVTTKTIFGMINSTTQGVYNFVMGLVISVYFLSAKESLCKQIKRLAVAFIPVKFLPKIYEIVDITDTKCGRFLVGDIIDAAFLGLLTFITMSIFQLPYAPLIAVLIGITNIIPFFGPFIGAVPSAFILLLIDPWDMICFVIIIVIIQQFDGNLFKPKIIGSQVGLSSFWVLFSVVVGGALFGLPGLILGTPIYAVIYSLVGKKTRNSIEAKGKIAQEALDFEVLNYTKIAEEQRKARENKENEQKEKLKKFIGLDKSESNGKKDADALNKTKTEKDATDKAEAEKCDKDDTKN